MSANTADLLDSSSALDLGNLRNSLMRMEDSIIFSLIERAQYKTNEAVYEPGCQQLGKFQLHQLTSAGSTGCLGDWFIYQTECLHSQVRRFQHPTEHPFFEPLPEPTLGMRARKRSDEDPILAPVPDAALVNGRLLEIYRAKMVPVFCEKGDDGNHGSTAVQDVHCLQTMATRIYYGLFVAEAKFRQEAERATALIKARDVDGLMAFITNADVEERNIRRVILKARTFSQDIASGQDGQLAPEMTSETTYKINPEYIGTVFREFLMPLTRDVEVAYLLARLDDTHPSERLGIDQQ